MGVSPVPTIRCLNPDTMAKPLAPYSNIARVKASDYLFIAGQIGTDKNGKAPADFEAQCALVFEAIGAATFASLEARAAQGETVAKREALS